VKTVSRRDEDLATHANPYASFTIASHLWPSLARMRTNEATLAPTPGYVHLGFEDADILPHYLRHWYARLSARALGPASRGVA